MHFILGVYAFLLNLYPLNFLEEFQDELQAVFAASLQDTGKMGKAEVALPA
jgi:hypothetical protein